MTSKDLFKGTTYNSLEEQVGGKHYRSMKIQPAEFINENKLLFAEGNAIKYICRHQSKGREQDIKVTFLLHMRVAETWIDLESWHG
jgi:hypothetical protein